MSYNHAKMRYTYAKAPAPEEFEYESDQDFICYPAICVFCDLEHIVELSDDGNRRQKCGKCKKRFYATKLRIESLLEGLCLFFEKESDFLEG